MTTPTPLFDRAALMRHRARAKDDALFLHRLALDEVQERLNDVNRAFTAPAIVTPFADIWRAAFDAKCVEDADILELEVGAHDLVIHAMCLHSANDPVGQIVQSRRALRPDGLFLGVCFGGQTLSELRACLAEAETRLSGGLSPRVAPMADIRDAGGLLQRAGLALPVADLLSQQVSYQTIFHLMRDLRAMGETNAMTARQKNFTSKHLFVEAGRIYSESFGNQDRVSASFDLIFLSGWAPHESQQKPLRPGSAEARLAEVLNTIELGPDGKPVKGEEE